jgi:hypothetical protein
MKQAEEALGVRISSPVAAAVIQCLQVFLNGLIQPIDVTQGARI